jgi:hypothetical protein
MSPFRDPEWQLHIPQKEYTTIVLTHLLLHFYLSGPVVRSQEALAAGPSLSAPEMKERRRRCRSGAGLSPCKSILSQKVKLEQERSSFIYGCISANSP